MLRPDLSLHRMVYTPGCTMSHVRVLLEITRRARHNPRDPDFGWSWPSKSQLAADTGLSLKSVKRCLAWLVERQVLHVERRPGRSPSGKQLSNRYWVLNTPPSTTQGATHDPLESTTDTPLQGVAMCDPLDLPITGGHPQGTGGQNPGLQGVSMRDPQIIQGNYPRENDPNMGGDLPPVVEVHHNGTGNGNGTGTGTGKKKGTWLTPYWDDWIARYGGRPPADRLSRAIRELHLERGEPTVRGAWRNFLTATPAKYATPERFAQTFGAWAGDKPQAVDQDTRSAQALGSWLRESPGGPP